MIISKQFNFPEVTLLITHYNRSRSLERLLEACRRFNYTFGDIIISDDHSEPEHFKKIEDLHKQFSFKLITSTENRGLGNNLNKGQDAVQTFYTLYVQEDFIPTSTFGHHFLDALEFMKERDDLDIIRFYSYLKYPYLKPYKKGYSEMILNPFGVNYLKIYFYSDHPHLRKSSFFEKFGRYREGTSGDRTEYRMCISVIQKNAKGLFFNQYKSLFQQHNTTSEPSTMTRVNWTQSTNPIIKFIRTMYRQLKYNYDIFFTGKP